MRLDFTLPRAQRLYLLVRAYPSCHTVGAVPFRGRAGDNTVRFAGRVGPRRLDPGVYLLTLSPTRTLPAGAESVAVRVVSQRRTVPVPDDARKPTCAAAVQRVDRVGRVHGVDRVAHLLRGETASPAALVSRSASPQLRPAAPFRPPAVSLAPPPIAPRGLPPVLGGDGPSGPLELLFTFAVFALLGGLIVVLFAVGSRALDRMRSA